MRYKYNGKITIYIPEIGLVRPNQVIDKKVNHPLFQKVKKEKEK